MQGGSQMARMVLWIPARKMVIDGGMGTSRVRIRLFLWSLLRKACSAEFLPEAAGRARVSGRDAAFAGWQ